MAKKKETKLTFSTQEAARIVVACSDTRSPVLFQSGTALRPPEKDEGKKG